MCKGGLFAVGCALSLLLAACASESQRDRAAAAAGAGDTLSAQGGAAQEGYGPAPDFFKVADDLIAGGGSAQAGLADDVGFWLVTVGDTADRGDIDESRAAAALRARAEAAAFIATKLSANTVQAVTEDDSGISAYFSRMSRADVDTLLRGLSIIAYREQNGRVIAVALLTQRTADAAKLLGQAMASARPGTVEAFGEGPTTEAALEAAKRNALEQVLGATVVASDATAGGELLRSRTYTDVDGVIAAFRVLSEEDIASGVRVRIVAEIDPDFLQDSYSAQLKSIGDPIFFLVSDDDDVLRHMGDWLIGKGLKVSTNQGTADYKVELTTKYSSATHPTDGRHGTRLQLTAVCYDKAGVQLFSLVGDPRYSTVFTGNAAYQQQAAAAQAVEALGDPLHKRLQQAVNDVMNNGRTVRLVFRNVTTEDQLDLLERITEELNDFPVTTAATYSLGKDGTTATVRCTLKGNPQDFLGLLRERVPELPEALTVSTNKIIFQL